MPRLDSRCHADGSLRGLGAGEVVPRVHAGCFLSRLHAVSFLLRRVRARGPVRHKLRLSVSEVGRRGLYFGVGYSARCGYSFSREVRRGFLV